MDPKATVQALTYAIQKGDFEKAKSHLIGDFQFNGYVPKLVILCQPGVNPLVY